MAVEIRTNNVPRELLSGWDLTEAEKAELDYIENIYEASSRFFRFKGNIYDIQEFSGIVPAGSKGGPFATYDHEGHFKGWNAVKSDSYFSGVLFKYVDDDFEKVVVGQYFS